MNVALNFMHVYHLIKVLQHSFGIRRFDCHYILCPLKSSDWLWWVTESDFPAGVSRATRFTRCSNHQSPDNSDAQIASCKGNRNTHAFSYMQYPKVLISFCWSSQFFFFSRFHCRRCSRRGLVTITCMKCSPLSASHHGTFSKSWWTWWEKNCLWC